MTAILPLVGALAIVIVTFVLLHRATVPALPVGHPSLGVVVHLLDATKASTVARMHVGSVLLPWYGDLDALRAQLAIAEAAGLHIVVRAQSPLTDAFATLVGKLPLVQVGNEPDDLDVYAGQWAAVRAEYGDRLSLIPAGLSNNTTSAQLARAIALGLGDGGVICLHVYGSPLVNAVRNRLAMAWVAGWTEQILFTEIGTSAPGDLVTALAAVPSDVSTWMYDLDGTDGYALTGEEIASVTAFAEAAS